MDRSLLLRNRAVARIVVGIPEGHQHLRARIESVAGDVITLQEATLAALARAYVDIKTHPTRRAIELRSELVAERKPGFAEHQLLEIDSNPDALASELAGGPQAATLSDPPEPEDDPDGDFATQPLPELDISSGELKPVTGPARESVFGETPTLATPRGTLDPTDRSDS
jgi:hypothetical protein